MNEICHLKYAAISLKYKLYLNESRDNRISLYIF